MYYITKQVTAVLVHVIFSPDTKNQQTMEDTLTYLNRETIGT